MEIEGILAHGTEQALKEMLTVNSDYTEGKPDKMKQLIETGKYHFPENIRIEGGTKKVVSLLAKFLQD